MERKEGGAEPAESLVARQDVFAKAVTPTLVVYVFANTDPEYEDNLQHFVREGIHVSLSAVLFILSGRIST